MASRKPSPRRRPESFINLRFDMDREGEYRMALCGAFIGIGLPLLLFILSLFLRG